MTAWLTGLWRRLTTAAPPAPPPQREHLPELHALKARQTIYKGRADLMRAQIAAALAAEAYHAPGGDNGHDHR